MEAFEAYARSWISLVNSMGGTHHGYFLPVEDSDEAVALFSFPSLEDFKAYRQRRDEDPGCKAAFAIAESTKCIVDYEGRFMRPVLPEAT